MTSPNISSPQPLTRKGIQCSIPVYDNLTVKKREKELKLAKSGKAREVTYDEVLREVLGIKE